MINVTKEFKIDMAHRLENFDGLCNNIHGHTYKLLTTFARNDDKFNEERGHNEGMVVDFKIIKTLVKEHIVDRMDHSFVYNQKDKDSNDIAMFMSKKIKQKLFPLSFRTTAENMARWMFEVLNNMCKIKDLDIKCTKVVLFETATSYAKYKE